MSKNSLKGRLTISVSGGRNLKVAQLIGEMDPYVVFRVGSEKFQTPVCQNGHRTPRWSFSAIANLVGGEEALHVTVFNKGNLTDDLLSRTDVDLVNLDLSGRPQWYSIRDPDNFAKEAGELELTFTFDGNGLPTGSRALATHQSRVGGGVAPSPISPTYAQPPQQQPAYTSQPPQYQQTQPNYQQPPPQPSYQQQPAPIYGQQPQYQQPQYQQPQYQAQPQFQPAPTYQQPQVVFMQQPAVSYQATPQGAYPPQGYPPQGCQQNFQPPPPHHHGHHHHHEGHQQSPQSYPAPMGISSAPSCQGQFDGAGYLLLHPDVKAAGMDAFVHWRDHGFREQRAIQLTTGVRGRFDSDAYLRRHPDVKNAGMDAFGHYTRHGHGERREIIVTPSAAVGRFDSEGYLQLHPDVRNAGMDAWTHYRQYGKNENRRIRVVNGPNSWVGTFVPEQYVRLHPDLVAARVDGWTHYQNHGHNETRNIVVQF